MISHFLDIFQIKNIFNLTRYVSLSYYLLLYMVSASFSLIVSYLLCKNKHDIIENLLFKTHTKK